MARFLFVLTAVVAALALSGVASAQITSTRFQLDPIALQIDNVLAPPIQKDLAASSGLIRVHQAREQFDVDGTGRVVVVLDTGANHVHVDFNGKLLTGVNYTPNNGGDVTHFDDGQGHGTNVAGIILANGIHLGIAPGADLIPMKVLDNGGSGSFDWTRDALQWSLDHLDEYEISVLNLSLGDSSNLASDLVLPAGVLTEIRDLITELRSRNVAVCIAAGNDYFGHNSLEGMGFPAVCRDSISVGALYDADIGPFFYGDGATANTTGPNRLTPFSQRLHSSTAQFHRTDVFAPGAPLTSTGIGSGIAESTMHGTSQATPIVSGVVALMQEYALRETGFLPSVDDLERWLRSGVVVNDGDDEDDNVVNTGENYHALDAYRSLAAMEADYRLARSEFRTFGYSAYVQAYYARLFALYATWYDGGVYVPYADAYSLYAFEQAAQVEWTLSFTTATRAADFAAYSASREQQFLLSYYTYFFASYAQWFDGSPFSQYAAEASLYAYAYGYYDTLY